MPICFFVRCKPQGADVIEIVKRTKRVFLGYPPYRDGAFSLSKCTNVPQSIYDLSVVEPRKLDITFLDSDRDRRSYSKQVSTNANLVQDVLQDSGSLVLIPRLEAGVCFLGEVRCFELVNDPPWLSDYKSLRLSQERRLRNQAMDIWSDDRNHLGDVVQTFVIDTLKAVPFFAVPAWIRHQLFQRATISLPIRLGRTGQAVAIWPGAKFASRRVCGIGGLTKRRQAGARRFARSQSG